MKALEAELRASRAGEPAAAAADLFAAAEIDPATVRARLKEIDPKDRAAVLKSPDGISAVALGRIAGVSDTTLGRWWRGRANPGDNPRFQIAAMFTCDDKKMWHIRPEYRSFFEA